MMPAEFGETGTNVLPSNAQLPSIYSPAYNQLGYNSLAYGGIE